MSHYKIGDSVAILSVRGTSPRETIAIGVVAAVGSDLIELEDSRLFHGADGQCVTDSNCIVPATDEHRTASQRRKDRLLLGPFP